MKQRNWERLIAGDTVKLVDPGSMLNGEIITIQPGGKYTWWDGSGNDIASLSPDRIKHLKLTPATRARLRALDCDEAVQTWQAECSALDAQAEPSIAEQMQTPAPEQPRELCPCCNRVNGPLDDNGVCAECNNTPGYPAEQPYVPGQAVEVKGDRAIYACADPHSLGRHHYRHFVSGALYDCDSADIRPCAAEAGAVVSDGTRYAVVYETRTAGLWITYYDHFQPILMPLRNFAPYHVMLLPRQPEMHPCCGGLGVHTTACNRDGQNPPLDIGQPEAEQPATKCEHCHGETAYGGRPCEHCKPAEPGFTASVQWTEQPAPAEPSMAERMETALDCTPRDLAALRQQVDALRRLLSNITDGAMRCPPPEGSYDYVLHSDIEAARAALGNEVKHG